jgi:outer membrane biosynthesis protein TonB
VRAARSQTTTLVLFTAASTLAAEGCPRRDATPVPDAATAVAPDVPTPAPRNRRRRRRPSVRSAVAAATHNARGTRGEPGADPARASDEDLALADEPEESAPRERPQMTETGPMLPEDLGRPASVTYDMTGGEPGGPMGLDPGEVARGFRPLMGRLSNCAAATTDESGRGPRGRVTVRLRIRPDGTPAAARVSGGNGPPEFITCVRRVVASARFAPFHGPDAFATWGFDVD